MKTEPNVPQFSALAKERICHALSQVGALTAAPKLALYIYIFFTGILTEPFCLGLYSEQAQQGARAVSVCSEVLQSDPENVNVLKDRAEAYVQDEQYEEGKPVGSTSLYVFTFQLCLRLFYFSRVYTSLLRYLIITKKTT